MEIFLDMIPISVGFHGGRLKTDLTALVWDMSLQDAFLSHERSP